MSAPIDPTRLLEPDRASERMRVTFESAYPHLSLELAWRVRPRSLGVWTATIRHKDGGRLVSRGVRRHQALALGAALAAIPERVRREPMA
ncbi:MAG TPA: hypothetical protein VEG84_08565 [Thermoanaerobaculia bacterium]|nr:hypothetical protein [Thermoanaerobaculia bacterium]